MKFAWPVSETKSRISESLIPTFRRPVQIRLRDLAGFEGWLSDIVDEAGFDPRWQVLGLTSLFQVDFKYLDMWYAGNLETKAELMRVSRVCAFIAYVQSFAFYSRY